MRARTMAKDGDRWGGKGGLGGIGGWEVQDCVCERLRQYPSGGADVGAR